MTKSKELEISNLKEFLKKNDIHPSYHRLKILEYLMKNRVHPTVEMIHKDISKEIPTLSKTTIYNTLNLFVEKKILIGLTIDKNKERYEINKDPHAHFKCFECEHLYDIPLDNIDLGEDEVKGHKIYEHHIYFKGICCSCNKEKKEK